MSKFKEINIDIFKRLESAGFTAIAITVDTQLLGKRENDIRNNFALPPHLKLASLVKYSTIDNSSVKTDK